MSSDKKNGNRPYKQSPDQGDDSGRTGSGGQGGQIQFRDFTTTSANFRDDAMPFEMQKQLLSQHKDIHEAKVKQQKEKRDQYNDLKNGKTDLHSYRQGLMGSGMQSQYKINPVLADKAQFSGIDRQVNALPTENVAETNEANRDELQNELKLRLSLQPNPTFNPKPSGF